jgi:hypothetical protein
LKEQKKKVVTNKHLIQPKIMLPGSVAFDEVESPRESFQPQNDYFSPEKEREVYSFSFLV